MIFNIEEILNVEETEFAEAEELIESTEEKLTSFVDLACRIFSKPRD